VCILYWAQLSLPLLLIVDVLAARILGYVHFGLLESDTIVLTGSVLWLSVGLTMLVCSRDRERFLRRASGPLTSLYMLFFCVLLLEGGARLVLPRAPRLPSLRPPGTRVVYDADSQQTPGIAGRKTFTVDEVGLRGPSFPTTSYVYKIITVGGSTTECAALDDSEEWPHLVMEELNAAGNNEKVWIGNAGVSGHTTADHLVLLETLPVFQKVNMVVFLIGVNDLEPAMAFSGEPLQSHLEHQAELVRQSLLAGGTWEYRFPLYKHLAVFRIGRKAGTVIAAKLRSDSAQQKWMDLSKLRQRRADARRIPIPRLENGLAGYRDRVSRLARQCRVLQLRCLFLTQPTIWRNDLSAEEQRMLWWGYVGRWDGPKGYAPAGDLAAGMDRFNRELLGVCKQDGLECFDLAAQVPKSRFAFYDDQHFSAEGARIVSRALTDYLLSRPPFRS